MYIAPVSPVHQSLSSDAQNGPLIGYVIGWTRPDTMTYKEYRVGSLNTSLVIGGLAPWVYYGSKVAAYNSAGLGPFSPTSYARTLPEGRTYSST